MTRCIRFGKYLLAHGSFAFRECPSCGKLNASLGDKWTAASPGLLPPLPLPGLSAGEAKPRTADEKAARDRGEADALQCVYCGAMTGFEHVRLAMQTSFKTPPPPSLEEMQRELRFALENARHILFLGYSLPPDDVTYRSILAARLARRRDDLTLTLVNYYPGAPDGWLSEREMAALPGNDNQLRKLYERLHAIVGGTSPKVAFRGYGRGVPAVFGAGSGGSISTATVRDLLFPGDLWANRRNRT